MRRLSWQRKQNKLQEAALDNSLTLLELGTETGRLDLVKQHDRGELVNIACP